MTIDRSATANRDRPARPASATSSCSTPTPTRCPTSCARSRRGSSATPTSRSTTTSPGSGTSGRRSGCGRGCGSSPAARSTSPTSATTPSTTSPAGRTSIMRSAAGHDQGVPQRLPAPRPPAEAVRRPLLGDPLPVPRLRLAPRRQPAGRPRPVGPPARHRRTRFHLPEVKVGTWDGFVFINPDPDAEPLEDFVGELAAHFDRWNLERPLRRRPTWPKVIRANWKIAQEAFCEAFHVNATHPQILPYIGDTNSQVDVWENCSRVITPAATPSPLLDWDARRRDDPALRARRARRRGAVHHGGGGPDRPLRDGRRHARARGGRSSAS